jgi:GTPase SAR1 family protein
MIIGPSQSGKTTFFYYLIGNENQKTIMSMKPNELNDMKISFLNNKYDIIDYPGTGYYQEMIINKINQSKIILLFIDSSDKNSIVQSAKYIYDILNSDKFDLDTNLVICCNKQDNNFPKTKKIY